MQTRATEKLDANAGKDRRLRAVYRRELQNSISSSALAVSAGIAATAVASVIAAPDAAPLYVAFAIPISAAGLLVTRAIRGRGRRCVVPLGMLVGLLAVMWMSASVVLVRQYGYVALGTFGLIPLAFAIFIPLERGPHLAWLILANLVFFGPVLVAGSGDEGASFAAAMFSAGAVATTLSLIANEVQLRRHRQMNGQILAVRGLYGRMKDHELDMRRQDEYLSIQQETLMDQQAELLRLNEELETIARIDALTGVGNRLRLNEDLASLAARIERNDTTAGLLLMDLDRFKRLNDSAGHLAGDAALRGVADILRKTSRVGDGVYRYGGEEFLIILHDCNESVLSSAGQRYISAIHAAAMPHPDNPPHGVVTASAGVTELSSANCKDVDSALRDADEALYAAKRRGRNRLEIRKRPRPAAVVPIGRRRAAG